MDIQKLISQMTIKEKLGQLTQFNAQLFNGSSAEITGPMTRNKLTPEDICNISSVLNYNSAAEMIQIQDEHLKKDRNKIPQIFMMDVIHGYKTIYPIPLALGCSFDTELVEQCSRMSAKEASAGGVHATFTPMVDYVRDARWGRVMECCGEEPMLNARMGAAQVRAFQGDNLKDPDNIATCVKHFAAYGGAEAGRDYNTVEISERILREYYLPAYKSCIDAGTTMVMPSFNSLNGIPSIANSFLMKQVLKNEWNFKGVVISDYNAVGELITHGIAKDRKDAALLAFQNGCDIEMCSSTFINHIEEWLNEGVITEEQIDSAVYRVLKLKDDLGLFEDPYRGASPEKEAAACLTPENRAIVRNAATECAVLLKNDGILPFSADVKKIAIIGPFADENGIIGFWSCHGKNEDAVSVADGVKAALPNAEISVVKGCGNLCTDTDTSGFDAAIDAAKNADIVILCLGEPQDYSGEGNSRLNITLPGVQSELAKAVISANPNTAAVIFNGRPLVLTELSKIAPAILDMWFPGTEGGNAVADLLFGKANPCGKVAMSFPKHTGQCPIYYNHPRTGRPKNMELEDKRSHYNSGYVDGGVFPLYPFGYGLSYSNFIYEDLTLSADSMTADQTVTASITVTNDSDTAGKEVVQLYMWDLVASTVRPVQQLIDFKKLEFAPHETKTVTFTIREEMLRFYDFNCNFISEPGEFKISTGYADNLMHGKILTLK